MEEVGKCNICKEVYTKRSVAVDEGEAVYVCEDCIEAAKKNFIWLCMCCGKTYIRPKDLVIARIKDLEIKRAYMLCENMQIIQGLDMCVACSPERILDIMEVQYDAAEC